MLVATTYVRSRSMSRPALSGVRPCFWIMSSTSFSYLSRYWSSSSCWLSTPASCFSTSDASRSAWNVLARSFPILSVLSTKIRSHSATCIACFWNSFWCFARSVAQRVNISSIDLFFSLADAGWAALAELVPNWAELCGIARDGAACAVLAVVVGAWVWFAAGCPNKDLVVAAGDGPGAAAGEAGVAVLNRERVGVAVVVAPNFSDGAADCAVADC